MSVPRFGVTKPVPVNLLMAALLLAGLYAAVSLRREFFPETTPDAANVRLVYPGATPEEIEESLAIKIEDRLADLEDVRRLTTTISEGGGGIIVEFREGIRDVYRSTDEVQREIDQLMDLPEEAERIQVSEFEPRLPVIMISLYGDADEEVMKRTIRGIRDDLISLRGMGEVIVSGVREYEVRIDVAFDEMLQHGISLPQISQAVRNWMREIPGGTVRTETGNISVRALGVEERADAIGNIVLRALPDGAALHVRDVAQVSEYFVDEQLIRRFNGQPAASLVVYASRAQDIVAMAETVRAYVQGRLSQPLETTLFERMRGATPGSRMAAHNQGMRSPVPLPPELTVETHSDLARFVEERLSLLTRNAGAGAILVFLTLLLFLNWRVAFWVGVGLTTAMAGALAFMMVLDITLNLLTMFGLIVVLGLLVDDAIVVAENIQARHDRGESSLIAAIRGAEQVAWPVLATVLTSIVAFLPLMFVRGRIGDLMGALPLVVAVALIMSLVESLLILPSHMGHSLVKRDKLRSGSGPRSGGNMIYRYELWRDHIIQDRIIPAYAWLLERSLRFRYVSVAAAVMILTISVGMVAGGRVVFEFLAASDSETIIVDIRMPIGTPAEVTNVFVQRFEEAAAAQPETKSISAVVGQMADMDTGATQPAAGHVGQMFIELHPIELRDRNSQQVIASIRRVVGRVDEAERVRYSEITGGPGGPDITVQIRGRDPELIAAAVADTKARLADFEGVVDIADDDAAGQREVQITTLPGAAALGFTAGNIAEQIRGALFGLDAHVFAAEREDIDVRVRLDEATRRDLYAVENLWLISPDGQPVPLTEVAHLTEGTGYSTIRRIDRMRAVSVTADTVPGVSPEEIMVTFDLRALQEAHPFVIIETAGRQEQLRDAFGTLPIGFAAALIMIYVILAWLFSSYIQPLAVMMAIPFGLIGVIWGHMLLGFELTFLSAIGFVALSGVIVNDSLILVQFYNAKREDGLPLREALIEAGRVRLRPIFLTTVTTVLGLTPLMLEQDFQARFLIPMAISIAFGLMFATIVILLVLPCIMVVVDDLRALGHFLWHGRPRETVVSPVSGELDAAPAHK